MTKAVAPPKSTGGGGFVFEDKVCAWFLTHILVDEPPFGQPVGRLIRIDFQTRPDGWFLDDLLLTLISKSGEHRCPLSVKSNAQFGVETAPADFVRTAWELFLHERSACFHEASDYLGLVTGPQSGEIRGDVAFVIQTARYGDPKLLPGRYAEEGWASQTRLSLFKSFACPKHLAERHGLTEADTGRLLARLQILEFDFELATSEAEKAAIERCRRALKSHSQEEAAALWAILLRLSSKRRPVAGSLTRDTLINELRTQFKLEDAPDHRADWQRLEHLSAQAMAQVRDAIGGQIHLQRDKEVNELDEALRTSPGAVLVGRSGVGKSVVVKLYAERQAAGGVRSLWFDARSFDRVDWAAFEADLKLSNGLGETLGSAPDERVLLILDGLDRLYDNDAFGIVASLVRALHLERQGTPWRVVVTCQTPEWPRLQANLLRAGVPLPTWPLIQCEPVSLDALEPVWRKIPQAARLQYQANLAPLLVNLKVLDLIASRLAAGGEVVTTTWVGESSVARWFWEDTITASVGGPSRARFSTLLAERQADELRLGIPLHSFHVSELQPLEGLVRDRICLRTSDDKVAFEHDLFGDWARMRILDSRSDELEDFLSGRLDSPLWHRALRLYGIYLLEHVGDLKKWRSTLSSLSATSPGSGADLLLEAVFFTANPLPLLKQLRADLLGDGGRLIRRLLVRFLAFATLPDPRIVALAQAEGKDDAGVAARYRQPNWSYWPPILRFMRDHCDECVAAAPVEVARIAELWLDHAPQGFDFRREAAELSLVLGERAIKARADYSSVDYKHRKLYYRVALAGAKELPDEVAAFALRACERTRRPAVVAAPPVDPDMLPKSIRFDPRFDPDEPEPEPWPDGPYERVDDDFQDVALESGVLIPLIRTRPAIAREVILASLIKVRRRFDWGDHPHEKRGLDLDGGLRWHPPLYTHGPFLTFLRVNFSEGLETIARLVDFASERWHFYTQMDAHEHEVEEKARGVDTSSLGRMISTWRQPPGTVVLPLVQGDRELIGDARVYGWAAGHGNPPSAVEAALMALEQYFYLELDEGKSVEDKARAVLDRSRSAAFLKVLCDIGKREPTLFASPLLPILAMPEVFLWDIQVNVQGRSHLLIGAPMQGRWFVQLAQAFHGMEHRSKDLREIAARLFIARKDVREYLAGTRERWEKRSESERDEHFREFLLQLLVSFNINNYRLVEHPEAGTVIVNVRAYELQAERTDETKAFEEQSFQTFLPIRCRQMIDEGTVLADEEFEKFWDQVQRMARQRDQRLQTESRDTEQSSTSEPTVGTSQIPDGASKEFLAWVIGPIGQLYAGVGSWFSGSEESSDDPETDGSDGTSLPLENRDSDYLANGLTGVAAVLVRLYSNRLGKNPERKRWCFDQLKSAVLNPPTRDLTDVQESLVSWTWDCFVAEALPVFWADEPDNMELRHLIARFLLFAPHNVAVKILFQRCAEHRAVLGADFHRLRRLLFELAHMRNRISFVQQSRYYLKGVSNEDLQRFGENMDMWAKDRITAFVKGELPQPTNRWLDMDQPEHFGAIDGPRQERYGIDFLDFRLVRAAHEWLPVLDQALSSEERRDWLRFWHAALTFALSRLSDARDGENLPHEDDYWVLDRVAAALPLMNPDEKPEDFWQPILDLPGVAHHWSENLLRSFYRNCLQQDPVPPRFAVLRAAIIEYALANNKGGQETAARWPYYEDVWETLVGIDGLTASLWEDRHKVLVEQGRDLFERWFELCQRDGGHLAAFSRWLERPATSPIRLPALTWLDWAIMGEKADRIFHLDSAEERLASLLNVVWRDDEVRLRQNPDAFAAFRRLLRWLTDQQNPLALELIRTMGHL